MIDDEPTAPNDDRPLLILGGAGFLGSNLAAHLARTGYRVRIYDDLSQAHVEDNVRWLSATFRDQIEVQIADVRDRLRLRHALEDVRGVFHFAAQTGVTTSLAEPRDDFEVNALGTLEVLEALRALATPPPLVFASSHKVYGGLTDVFVSPEGVRWSPIDEAISSRGIDERRPLEFCTPYGCSKGAADQYVIDYAHSFGLPATVLRLSCIYGPRQFGNEDQGWIAHFLLRALDGEPITIYGDGRQVRDVLYVDDVVDALVRAWSQMELVRGHVFNVGGGPRNTLSVLELIETIALLRGERPELRFEDWRHGDPRYYVSDTTAYTVATGWRPIIAPRVGIEALHGWLVDQRSQGAP